MDNTILGTSKVSSKFQIVIPVDVRKKYKINIADLIIFKEEGERLIIEKA